MRSQDAIRRGPANFVEKVQSALLQRLYPDSVPWVRGNVVAAGSVVEAIVKHGTMESYELFAHPSFKEAAAAEVKSYARSAPGAPQVTVTALDDALREGFGRHPLMGWFDPLPLPSGLSPTDTVELSRTLRAHWASRIYPITTLTHGLSLHLLLYDVFLRIMLEGTYPCDSFICGSRASCAALNGILAQVAEEFGEKFGSNLAYNGRVDVIPLGMDIEKFKPRDKGKLRKELRLPADAVVILFLGRLSPLKADLLPIAPVIESLTKRNLLRKVMSRR